MRGTKIGLNKQNMKTQNRRKILELIATGSCNTRIGLSKKTGLSKMTVSNIVSEMLESDVIMESEKDFTDGQGRNPVKLCIAPKAPKVVGILVFRGYCEAVLCGIDLKIVRRERVLMDRATPENFINLIYSLLDTVILDETNIAGIGVASIGPVDVGKGMILSPNYFYGIHDVPIVELIQQRYNYPIYFDHDNQSGALAEVLFGNGRKCKGVLLVGVSDGVGCGIIMDEKLHSNCNGFPPELGHVSIDYNGSQCACGNRGCLETYIRTPLMLDKLRNVTGKFYSYEQFCELAEQDEKVHMIFTDAIEKMSMAIVSVLNILNSEMVLLSYDCVYWKERYIELLKARINERKFYSREYNVQVEKTYFGFDSQLFGAACNVISKLFWSDIPLQ